MTGPSDEALYQGFRHGDAAAFDMLYQRYRQPLFLFLLRSCQTRADAEDLYQELWNRVIQAGDGFREGSFRAWVFRIARNLQIDRYRRERVRPLADTEIPVTLAAATPTPEQQADAEDCHGRLLTAIGALPPEQREALLLREESGLALADIAALAGVGRETIKSRLRYALKRLRATLEDCL
jgi:RNA polymerase sigma factor (sigma-70 family)